MQRYRTEILIPPDRTLVLQLPDSLPEGRATLLIVQADEAPNADHHEPDPDRQDIEWWDEFDTRSPEGGTP